jgi:hypothetical protein
MPAHRKHRYLVVVGSVLSRAREVAQRYTGPVDFAHDRVELEAGLLDIDWVVSAGTLDIHNERTRSIDCALADHESAGELAQDLLAGPAEREDAVGLSEIEQVAVLLLLLEQQSSRDALVLGEPPQMLRGVGPDVVNLHRSAAVNLLCTQAPAGD